MKKFAFRILAVTAIANTAGVAYATPEFDKQPHPESVVNEHLEALNDCDVDRLMAQYPDSVVLVLPGGITIQGRENARALFEGLCTPFPNGLEGIQFTELSSWTVGKTVIVQWRADAPFDDPFICGPYLGADTFVTKNGLLAAQVATFDGADLPYNPNYPGSCPQN